MDANKTLVIFVEFSEKCLCKNI